MKELFDKGEKLFSEGALPEARKCFLEVIESDTDNKEAYNNLGVIAYQLKQFEQARNYIKKALKIDPGYQDAIDNLTVVNNAINLQSQKNIESPQKDLIEESRPDDIAKNIWRFSDKVHSPNPIERINALVDEGNKQVEAERFDLAEISFWRVALLTRYAEREVVDTLARLYQRRDDIPAIKEIYKRAAVSAMERNRLSDFLDLSYLSIYAEHMFGKNPNYSYSNIDEDINAFVRMTAKCHPLNDWVFQNRKQEPAGDKLRIGFVTEGLSQYQASVRTYYPLTEYHDHDKYEIYFYTRWWLDEPLAQKQDYRKTVENIKGWGGVVRAPEKRLDAASQADFITRKIVEDKIDALVFQTTYFVPVYNLVSCFHPAPFQAAIAHQQPEFSYELDLLFSFKKVPLESPNEIQPFPMAQTRKSIEKPHSRSEFNVPEDAILMITAAREMRYSQPRFWVEVAKILKRNPNLYYIPLGLSKIGDFLGHDKSLEKRVKTVGYRTDVMEFMGMADFYLDMFPTGTGSSVIEAMQAGLPVILFEQNYGTRYAIGAETVSSVWVKERDLIVPHGDLRTWHQNVDRIVKDKEWRELMSRKMKEHSIETEPEFVTRRFFEGLERSYRNKMKRAAR